MDFLEPVQEAPPWKLTLLNKLKQRDKNSEHLFQILKQLESSIKRNNEYRKKISEMERTMAIMSKRSKKLLHSSLLNSTQSTGDLASITESTLADIGDEEIVKHIAFLQSRLNNSNDLNKELEKKYKEIHQKYIDIKSYSEQKVESRETLLNRIKILEQELQYTRQRVCDLFDENIVLQLENTVMLSKIS